MSTQTLQATSSRVSVLVLLTVTALVFVFLAYNDTAVLDAQPNDLQEKAEKKVEESEPNKVQEPVASCVWDPKSQDSCTDAFSKHLHHKGSSIDGSAAVPRRWLFFGDSTVARLFTKSKVLVDHFVDEPARDNSNACQAQFQCKRHEHGRCKLAEFFQQQPATHWIPPNTTLGEGPKAFGAKNPFCSDCSGCSSVYTICKPKSAKITNCDTSKLIYGGFFSVEFARDVVLQTTQFQTTQENVAQFVHDHFNEPASLQTDFGGKPICVASAGLHDMGIKKITASKFVGIVHWYLELLQQQCDSIVWLQNTAPQRQNSTDPFTSFPQHWVSVEAWNRAVHQHLNETVELDTSRILVMDVFESSKAWPFAKPDDNIHKSNDWYEMLASFFKDMAQEAAAQGSNTLQATQTAT
ncbi:expressed unknown protein [Seminavis robusta]|uniref:Uncharacterized protein n=1 Tax=Seminavis robusta TaxID=568900 RepID=A0A9N8E8M6_9STRA|nr:expressed unknown protein [Seminavis robusta]|eukprot:Sro667_g184190.1 n/a (409) ;mRNA; f:33505-34731